MTLLQYAFVLLAAGAAGGVTLALLAVFRVGFPRWFGAAHGLLNLIGLALLLASNLTDGGAVAAGRWWALGILAGALLGGILFFRVIFPNRIRLRAAALHGALALVGLYVLAPTTGLV